MKLAVPLLASLVLLVCTQGEDVRSYLSANGTTTMQCGTYQKLATDVSVVGRKIFVGGKRWIIKGVAYEAKPLGLCRRADMQGSCPLRDTSVEAAGTSLGYCYGGSTTNMWFAPEIGGNCYDSDSANFENFGRWQRDLDLMADIGINTVRLYHANPQSCTSNLNKFGTRFASNQPGLRDHIPFFNYCSQKGIRVIWPLFLPDSGTILRGEGIAALNAQGFPEKNAALIQLQLDELDGHPALLMYSVGNELIRVSPTFTDSKILTYINQLIGYVKSKSRIPVTHALIDYPPVYPVLAQQLNVDVFSVNVYRGNDLTSLWEELANITHPVLIAELGAQPIQSTNGQLASDWPVTQWKDIMRHSDMSVGACYFQFLDVEDKSDGRYGMFRLINFPSGEGFFDDIRANRHDDPTNQAEHHSSTGAPLDRPLVDYYRALFQMTPEQLIAWGQTDDLELNYTISAIPELLPSSSTSMPEEIQSSSTGLVPMNASNFMSTASSTGSRISVTIHPTATATGTDIISTLTAAAGNLSSTAMPLNPNPISSTTFSSTAISLAQPEPVQPEHPSVHTPSTPIAASTADNQPKSNSAESLTSRVLWDSWISVMCLQFLVFLWGSF